MPAYTFFHNDIFENHGDILLNEEESHHALSVMRLEAGEIACVINGKGQMVKARLLPSKKTAKLEILELIENQTPPLRKLRVLQGLTSIAKADLIVEKLTELNIDQIAFFAAERSGRQKLNTHQLEKLHLKAIAACKQSGRLWLPTLHWYDSLEESLDFEGSVKHQWITLDPFGNDWKSFFIQGHTDQNYTLVVGPESGLSQNEISYLETLRALRLSLHPNVLRAETAAVVGACLLEHYTR